MKKIYTLLAALACICGCDRPAEVLFRSTVFEKGEGGIDTYRIPATVKSKAGTILAFAEARHESAGDSGHIDLVLKRSTDAGKSWGPMITVWGDGKNVCGNPSPVVLTDGRILLVCTWNKGSDREMDIHHRRSEDTRRVFCLYSDDDGLSWSAPKEITSQVKDPEWTWYATGPGHALLTESGRVVVPCNHGVWDEGARNTCSHLILSDDGGRSWRIGAVLEKGNECSVSEFRKDELLVNIRDWRLDGSEREHCRLGAFVEDGGERADPQGCWTIWALPDPNCQGSQIADRRGRLYFSNPEDESQRRNLTVRKDISGTGQTWIPFCTITEGPAAYSDLVILRQPLAMFRQITGVLYETGEKSPYERIDFAVFR